jgi:hypothetical protein
MERLKKEGMNTVDLSLLNPNFKNMNVHSSAWFFLYYSPKGSAKLRRAGRGSGDII